MICPLPPSILTRMLALGVALLSLAPNATAQLPASSPLADPADKSFQGVTEDWTTPALSSSHLMSAPPLGGFVDDTHAGYTVQLLQLQWRWGDPLDLYVIKPKGVKNPPVILNLYGYPADTEAYKNAIFQNALAKDGFAAVGFVSALTGHRYHDRPMREWFLSELQESLATSAHDVQMVLNYLAARSDLDMNRVGIFGQGSGASIAILASAVDPRIKVLDVLDPWGDWPAWISTSPFVPEDERAEYMKPEFLKRAAALEPVEWMPKLKAKKFRLQQNIFDSDTPKTAKEKLRAATAAGTAVVLYKTLSEFNTAFPNSTNLEWMKHELRSLPEAGSTATTASPSRPQPQ
jgi:dienelactone hydrolase